MNAGPSFEDLFEIRPDGVAVRRAGAAAAARIELARQTIPISYRERFTRAAWVGPWPFADELGNWPAAAGSAWSLLLLGPPGTGKTHCATVLFGEAVARSPHGGTWLDCAALMREVRNAISHRGTSAAELACFAPGVLLLDDLGAQRDTPHARTFLTDVLMHRHRERLPTILTANATSAAELEAALDTRVLSRFSEGEIALLDGPDRRAA